MRVIPPSFIQTIRCITYLFPSILARTISPVLKEFLCASTRLSSPPLMKGLILPPFALSLTLLPSERRMQISPRRVSLSIVRTSFIIVDASHYFVTQMSGFLIRKTLETVYWYSFDDPTDCGMDRFRHFVIPFHA